jgi:hypothetical protein
MSQRANELVDLIGRRRSIEPAVPLSQIRVVVLRAEQARGL